MDLDKALDKQYRYLDYHDGKIIGETISTFRKQIAEKKYIRSEKAEVPSVRFKRTKYNRMSGNEQQEYDRRLNEMKTEYRLYENDTVFTVVSKMIYDYFNENIKKRCEKNGTENGTI